MSDRPLDQPVADLVAAMQGLSIGVLVLRGPGHEVTAANAAARTLLGGPDEVLGRTLHDLLPAAVASRLDAALAGLDGPGSTGSVDWPVPGARRVRALLRAVDLAGGDAAGGDAAGGVVCELHDASAERVRRLAVEADAAELRTRYAAARAAALELQRGLLPAGLPVLPGMRIAAHYLVAAPEQAAGGDWFEAVPLDGRVAAIVGDVVGHGPTAAAVMGRLRAVLEEFLLDGDALDTVLARLDAVAARVPGARGATVCVTLVDPGGAVRYVCAGHPPPLVLAAGGGTRFLPAPGGGPLGVAGPAPTVGSAVLDPGDVLVCYSDGLVERPEQDLATGLAELAEVVGAAADEPGPAEIVDRVAELTLARMAGRGYQDDVTVLAVRLTGEPDPGFDAEIPAEPRQLAGLRRLLEDWLVGLGTEETDLAPIEIAVLEAVSNSVEHAYLGRTADAVGTVRVEGRLDGTGRVGITVSDDGAWKPAAADPGHRGRGLLMMRGCMDTVEIEHSAAGTVLLLDRRLRRAPVISPAPPVTEPVPRPSAMTVTRTVSTESSGADGSAEPRVAVGGPIAIDNAADLRRELWSASRGGALPLVVDLTAVTHLASAGVQVLYDFVEDMRADGRALRFVVPAGSPARYALTLSDLDRVVEVTEN